MPDGFWNWLRHPAVGPEPGTSIALDRATAFFMISPSTHLRPFDAESSDLLRAPRVLKPSRCGENGPPGPSLLWGRASVRIVNYSSAYFYGVETMRRRRASLSGRGGKGTRFSYMSLCRRVRLASVLICLFIPLALVPAWSQTQPQTEQAKPATNQSQPQQPDQEPKKPNPFENVPQTAPHTPAPAPAQQPGKPQLEAPKTRKRPPRRRPATWSMKFNSVGHAGSRRTLCVR